MYNATCLTVNFRLEKTGGWLGSRNVIHFAPVMWKRLLKWSNQVDWQCKGNMCAVTCVTRVKRPFCIGSVSSIRPYRRRWSSSFLFPSSMLHTPLSLVDYVHLGRFEVLLLLTHGEDLFSSHGAERTFPSRCIVDGYGVTWVSPSVSQS